ncbi:hypothetical protein PIB30_081132 [Stylosanthes scabra]|uniref:Uncharacterized protein n=1 Tax=Stylosanthes scabra TaxID=79078 RepID=A0ABU6VR94_9FABA|nr:hypothetical protein [Stylosanthes scabra]
MEKSQADYMEEVKQIKAKQEQERPSKEIQEVRKSQITQTLANNKRLETEKNMQLAIEKQGRDIVEMRKQLNLWTRNTSAREAYTCWAHQQANPNLSEIPITQIPDKCGKRNTYVLWVPQIRLWSNLFLTSLSSRAGTVADCTSFSRFPSTKPST